MTAASSASDVLTMTGLPPLMAMEEGDPDVVIGLLDGPVAQGHPELAGARIRGDSCIRPDSVACRHGTFVAGILSARRTSSAPAICPGCTLLTRPIFPEGSSDADGRPRAQPEWLAEAIIGCLDYGARILNLSVTMGLGSSRTAQPLQDALAEALARGAITVAAAGNEGALGTSAITD